MSHQVVYHGTNMLAAKIILKHGIWLDIQRRFTDFGRGFYVTTQRKQAKRWAFVKANEPQVDESMIKRIGMSVSSYLSHPDTKRAAYLFFDLDLETLQSLRGKCFKIARDPEYIYDEEECLQFINRCRAGMSHQYDYVYGPVGRRIQSNPSSYSLSVTLDQLSLNSDEAIQCLSKPTLIQVKEKRNVPVHSRFQLTPSNRRFAPYLKLDKCVWGKIREELMKRSQLSKHVATQLIKQSWMYNDVRASEYIFNEPAEYWAYSIANDRSSLWYQEYESYLTDKQNDQG